MTQCRNQVHFVFQGENDGGFHMGGTNKGSSAKGQGFNLKF